MEMKDYLNKVIAEKRAKIADLQKRGQESEDVNEVKAIISEVEELRNEIADAEAQLATLDEKVVEEIPEAPAEEEIKEEAETTEEEKEEETVDTEKDKEEETAEEVKEEEEKEPTAEEIRSSADWQKVDASNLNTLASYEQRGGNKMENLEMRTAFMNAIQNGDLSKLEKRADAYTTAGNVEYVIPENLVNDIITEINDRGYILSLCNKTNYAVGQTIPVGLISISASWVGTTDGSNNSGEGLGSSVQAGGVESTITFLNYKLRCVVGLTHEAGIQSLPIFEKKFVQQVADAMIEALETAVVSGTGVNQPKGILLETPKAGKALVANELTYADALKFVGSVPKKYRNGAVAFMSQNTFYDFMAIVDKNGQPVARVNAGVDGDMKQYLFGMPVIFADEYLADFATAETNATFAFIYNFKEYTLNTNYNLGISQRDVWENENREIKAVLACDGKAVTINSLVTFKKGISA
jgi:HK97 family phage major capsid protein